MVWDFKYVVSYTLLDIDYAVADTGGLQWFQMKPPLKICVCCIQLTSGCVGDTLLVTVQVKGFRRLLSVDKPIFRLRKATKVATKTFF